MAYTVIIIHPDGTISFGIWDDETNTFSPDTHKPVIASIDEYDAQHPVNLYVAECGIITTEGEQHRLINFYDEDDDEVSGITFLTLHQAVQALGVELNGPGFGYSVYQP